MAYKKHLSVYVCCHLRMRNLNQAIVSPNEYNGISESDAEIKQIDKRQAHFHPESN